MRKNRSFSNNRSLNNSSSLHDSQPISVKINFKQQKLFKWLKILLFWPDDDSLRTEVSIGMAEWYGNFSEFLDESQKIGITGKYTYFTTIVGKVDLAQSVPER